MNKNNKFSFLFPLAGVMVAGLSLEFCCRLFSIPAYLLPPPSLWLLSLIENQESLIKAWKETFFNSLAGFCLSLLCGVGLSLLLSLNDFLRRMFYPLFVIFQTIPIVAIAPLMVIWFGFGSPTVIASSFFVSLFPVLANTMSGLFETDPELLELLKSLKARRLQTLMLLRIPSSLSNFFTGLKIAMGLALIGAVVGEFIAGTGLGSVIDSARSQQRVDLVFAAVLLLTLSGLGLIQAIDLVWAGLLKWRPLGKN